jgi:hypothetical protein
VTATDGGGRGQWVASCDDYQKRFKDEASARAAVVEWEVNCSLPHVVVAGPERSGPRAL